MRTRSSMGGVAAATIAALAFSLSCATPPRPADEAAPIASAPAQVEPAAVQQDVAAVPAPDEIRAKAAALRKKAFDLGIKEILREEYSEAESAYAAGTAAYGKDNAASADSFTEAAERFGELVERGLPIIAGNERERAEGLRAVAAGKGSGESFPEHSSWAEAEFGKAASSQASGEFESAIAEFRAAAKNFEVIYKLCDANFARNGILDRDFAKWDPSNWTLAEARFASARDLLRSDASGAASSVDEALLRYGIASRNALEYYAGDRKSAAESEKARAAGIKSEVAVKQEYAAALALESRAATAHAGGDFDGSSALYESAASAFASVYSLAKSKMDTAKFELDSLDEALAAKDGI